MFLNSIDLIQHDEVEFDQNENDPIYRIVVNLKEDETSQIDETITEMVMRPAKYRINDSTLKS